ncbi:Uncharacterised protein [Corynebacterium kutscheri]|uniref:Uncharacterized protein n=1 Tax=Corynebacterium kutscheri TaxID=35755 RepID=A0A0F6QZY3_9CORY|nr:hypothetical protein [Corynebacterium kutscheri]AKE41402.1 hypothetical protein UL82_06180 [Corynebacterium kutscheri]VEH08679.1 Uncharacterised protein [Corynebacterium kutscheri]VEH09726.1 Uncharacterised protein [Corynebacterium kutscheri]VEH79809.1 Uncharacterised protein [Corynebacterium kutscheri]
MIVIMPDFDGLPINAQRPRWPLIVIVIGCLVLIWLLKFPGVVLASFILLSSYLLIHFTPDEKETAALRSSITLSMEDIQDVLDQYHDFLHGQSTETIADRTLYRPALADLDCQEEAIERFHYLVNTSDRFTSRMHARLERNLNITQLEKLLQIADARAAELEESWLAARKAARRLSE